MDAIRKLRAATAAKKPVQLEVNGAPTDSIKEATHVLVDGTSFPLDETTAFQNEGVSQPLRAVVFCWMHDKSSIVDYKNACLENSVPDFKFLVKAELTTWLAGNSDTCQFLADLPAENGEVETKKRKADPQLERIAAFEENAIDHNAALRGDKNIVFKNLISDAKRFAGQLKKAKAKPSRSTQITSKKQPIIIVSPATTALLSLGNIKEFLETGRFVEPKPGLRPELGVVTISHPSDRLLNAAHTIMVVDNVDMFTKPEYWDRVVAIFTTGQAWQFAKYKYSKPEALFQKYAGFYMAYQGDVVPRQIEDWNVLVVKVDRGEKRFRDKMIVRDLWVNLEKTLVAKGYGEN